MSLEQQLKITFFKEFSLSLGSPVTRRLALAEFGMDKDNRVLHCRGYGISHLNETN